jgi:hypothetical protein
LVDYPRGEERHDVPDRPCDEGEYKRVFQCDEEHVVVHEEKLVVVQSQPFRALKHVEIGETGTRGHENGKYDKNEKED